MKTESIKTMAIAILIITNVFCLYKICGNHNAVNTKDDDCPDCPTVSKSCDNDLRYNLTGNTGGGFPLNTKNAQDSLTEFKTRIKSLNECAVKGGCPELKFPAGCWISKLAIDNLFEYDIKANGLYCNFVYSKSKDSVSIVISPFRNKNFLIQQPGSTQHFFMSETLCPKECGAISK